MLCHRLLSAVVLVPVVLGALYLAAEKGFALPLVALVLAATGMGTYELYRMAQKAGRRPWAILGVPLALLLVLEAAQPWAGLPGRGTLSALLALGAIASLVGLLLQTENSPGGLADWAITLAGAIYVGGLMRYGVLLPSLPEGFAWSLAALLGTWACDSAAFFVGGRLGRRQLGPHISPAKTWEGTVAGGLAAVGVGLFMAPWLRVGMGQGIVLGLLIGVAAVVGDLAESKIKRSLGAKDAGGLIPGHGGLLDRLDSLLFVMVGVYVYARWVVG